MSSKPPLDWSFFECNAHFQSEQNRICIHEFEQDPLAVLENSVLSKTAISTINKNLSLFNTKLINCFNIEAIEGNRFDKQFHQSLSGPVFIIFVLKL